MRSARAAEALLVGAWLWTAAAGGQIPSPTGNLYGTALDTDGNALAGVAVTLDGLGAPQAASTDRNGDFHFLELSPGAYGVRLERAGFETARRDVLISLGNVVLSIVMSVAGPAETVIITGDAILDARQVETGATFGQRELESIPTTRDPWAILRQVPGVLVANVNVGGSRHPRQQPFVGKGSQPDQNTYNLNGVQISQDGVSPLYYDFDSFSNIEVVTGGSDPSLSSPGVALNLVTKRGTNQFLGSVHALYTGTAGWDYGANAGGPVWKDRIWLWGAYARNAYLGQTFLAAGTPVENVETSQHWNAKVIAAAIPANELTVSYTDFDRVAPGVGAGPDHSLPTTWTNTLNSQVVNVADSQVLSPGLFASFNLAYVKGVPMNTPEGGPDEQADVDEFGVWQHSFSSWHLTDSQRSAGLQVSTFFDTGTLRHELKFGFGYRHAGLDSASTWPGDQLVGDAQLRDLEDGRMGQTALITRRLNVKSESNTYDAFLGDTIQTSHVTINVGVRFDYQQGRNGASSVPSNPVFPELLPAVSYGGDPGYPITWRAVQPRIGVTYAPGSDRRTLVRASYSRFADQLGNTARTVNAFPSIAVLPYVWADTNGNGRVERDEVDLSQPLCCPDGVDPADTGSSVQINTISKSLGPPTTDEFIVGVERQILPDLSGSLAYTYRVSRGIEFSPWIGTTRSSYEYFGNATGTAVSESDGFSLTFNEPYYGLVDCPGSCVGTVLENRPDVTQAYSGVELQLLKAFSHGWMARVSFAYNDWQQQVGPGGIVDPNNEPPGTNASGPYAGGLNAKWQFNLSGMVELPLGLAAGASLFGRQGFPIPYSVFVILPPTAFKDTTLQIGPATHYRTPNVFQLDLQISRPFALGSTVTVIPQLACFNLIDSRTVLERDGFAGTYDAFNSPAEFRPNEQFNDVVQVISHRVFRGGVRITF